MVKSNLRWVANMPESRSTLVLHLLPAVVLIGLIPGAFALNTLTSSTIELQIRNTSTDGIGAPFSICVALYNEQDEPIENASITFSGGLYFSKQQRLRPVESRIWRDVCFQLLPRVQQPTCFDVPQSLHILIESHDGDILCQYEHGFSFRAFFRFERTDLLLRF